jgi:hypothetical protein
MAGGQIADQLLVPRREAVGRQDQACGLTGEAFDGGANVRDGPDGRHDDLRAKALRCGLDGTQKKLALRRNVGIEHDGDTSQPGRDLLEQLDPFAADSKTRSW